MSLPQPQPRLDALGAQLRAMQIAKHLPAPSGSVTVSAVRKDAAPATPETQPRKGTQQ